MTIYQKCLIPVVRFSSGKILNLNSVKFSAIKHFSTSQADQASERCKILVVGGGAGGCSVASRFARKFGKGKVIILEPENAHYYQPLFTLVGAGIKKFEKSCKPMGKVLPNHAKWIQEKAVEFDPDQNTVTTSEGKEICYDILIIATGLKLEYGKIPGLTEALCRDDSNVTSVYSPLYVKDTFKKLCNFKGGNAIFTFPNSAVKCPGAPQKIMYLAEEFFRKRNVRSNAHVMYATSLSNIFGVKHYADALWKVANSRDIDVNLRMNLVEVRADKNIAVFEDLCNPRDKKEIEYSFLHVTPPHVIPPELTGSKALLNEAGFINVNNYSMQHEIYPNIFAIGDSVGCPCSKTAAAAAAQSPVVYHNVLSKLKGKELQCVYDGYASCPLITGYNKCILAEFDYDLIPKETFPFAQNIERHSMFYLKRDILPLLYWKLMLKGYWNGPETFRKALSIFKSKKADT